MPNLYTTVRHFIACVLIVLYPVISLAWPPTYGAEFELTNKKMGKLELNEKNRDKTEEKAQQVKLAKHILSRCASTGCRMVEIKGKWDTDYRIEYPDGWWIKISYDPTCVEITFKPSTLEELKSRAQFLNDQIFRSAKEIGLYVQNEDNSHFNMGIRSAFDDSGKDFLRFFVDYANRPDLALGSLGHDINNAPPLSVLKAKQRRALKSIIDRERSGKLKTIAEIAAAIENEVYTHSYEKSWGGKAHYQAVGLKYVNQTDLRYKDAPMELRSVWIQESAEKFNLVSRLIEGRIKYLKTVTDPIIYVGSDRDYFTDSELRTRFFIYVEEAGMKYSEFETLLPETVRNASFDPILDSSAKPVERLSSIEYYWDLAPASPAVRKAIVEILSHPDLSTNTEAQALRDFIKASSIQSKLPFLERNWGFLNILKGRYKNFLSEDSLLARMYYTMNSRIEMNLIEIAEKDEIARAKQANETPRLRCSRILM